MPAEVSFIIPTLNRGRYVLRAVESCLTAGQVAGATVEVVVLDSESDDGSWEALEERFGSHAQVRLSQNRRGLGPTRSWLDGARMATGSYLTFLWSDDYVFPHFLSTLLPAIRAGGHLAVGQGLVRDLEEEAAPNISVAPILTVTRGEFLASYVSAPPQIEGFRSPVSPACGLFSLATFRMWIDTIEEVCTATPLHRELLWRRAIGPDLLLFMMAISLSSAPVKVTPTAVAQFSAHEGSITISSTRWPLQTGYWLARNWFVRHGSFATIEAEAARRLVVAGLSKGLHLAAAVPPQWKVAGEASTRLQVLRELRTLMGFSHAQVRPLTLIPALSGRILRRSAAVLSRKG